MQTAAASMKLALHKDFVTLPIHVAQAAVITTSVQNGTIVKTCAQMKLRPEMAVVRALLVLSADCFYESYRKKNTIGLTYTLIEISYIASLAVLCLKLAHLLLSSSRFM
jgi:hypothetical protein